MTTKPDNITDKLPPWESLRHQWQYERAGILIGNGASRAVWHSYGYDSLYRQAFSDELEHCLDAADQTIFESLGTQNFETVLSGLRIAQLVGEALGHDVSDIRVRYANIRSALIDAVHHVHIDRQDASKEVNEALDKVLRTIRAELRRYDHVFSTNYDLLLYWAMMSEHKASGFVDYFWLPDGPHNLFDITRTKVIEDRTKVLYLHGGLHLVRLSTGQSAKLKWDRGGKILSQFAHASDPDSVPLFVSEGDSTDKERAIRSSDYLTFALDRFTTHRDPLVIFGHGLSESDAHLVRAMSTTEWKGRPIAISILPAEPHEIRERKASYFEKLPRADLSFFDATTHPLGAPSLRVSAI